MREKTTGERIESLLTEIRDLLRDRMRDPHAPPAPRCRGLTAAGTPCRNEAKTRDGYCPQHAPRGDR